MQTTVSTYFIVPGITVLWGNNTEICKMLGRHAVLLVTEWLYCYWGWVIIVLQHKSVLYAKKPQQNMARVLFLWSYGVWTYLTYLFLQFILACWIIIVHRVRCTNTFTPRAQVESLVHLICTPFDCRKILENLEKTHRDIEEFTNACKYQQTRDLQDLFVIVSYDTFRYSALNVYSTMTTKHRPHADEDI